MSGVIQFYAEGHLLRFYECALASYLTGSQDSEARLAAVPEWSESETMTKFNDAANHATERYHV